MSDLDQEKNLKPDQSGSPQRFLDSILTAHIDRPLGSRHPQHDFIYPLNYGYLPGVRGADGEDLDVYVLGVFEPLETFTGRCIAVLQRLDDEDDKLILAPVGVDYSADQIRALVEFQERFFHSRIVRPGGHHGA
ncbi:MAG: inorganic diphosphatase [Anaerolineales bacterium]|nr:inorganic diphosphatase [Anaerolineales bacterium]